VTCVTKSVSPPAASLVYEKQNVQIDAGLFDLSWSGSRNCLDFQLFHSPLKNKIMKKNMGNTDRIVRVLIAIVIAALYFTGTITGLVGTILLVLAGVFVATSVVSFCPLYTIVGLNTCPAKQA